MVQLVTSENRHFHRTIVDKMFEDRKTIFVDLLKWEVPHDGRFERDQFDDEHAEYLIVNDADRRRAFASLRC
jgi:acyl-homoserine lactone synthase